MKTTHLPSAQTGRLARLRHALVNERRPHGEFHGKRLRRARQFVSIPFSRRWRALFVRTPAGYGFRGWHTHENYNKLNHAVY